MPKSSRKTTHKPHSTASKRISDLNLGSDKLEEPFVKLGRLLKMWKLASRTRFWTKATNKRERCLIDTFEEIKHVSSDQVVWLTVREENSQGRTYNRRSGRFKITTKKGSNQGPRTWALGKSVAKKWKLICRLSKHVAQVFYGLFAARGNKRFEVDRVSSVLGRNDIQETGSCFSVQGVGK
ncbi:MAG: hypothetical protein IPI39_23165 [Candidatus Obscuribacter sp.]|nr:hypothetical protein [Candidatus Obscuribacter sp.]